MIMTEQMRTARRAIRPAARTGTTTRGRDRQAAPGRHSLALLSAIVVLTAGFAVASATRANAHDQEHAHKAQAAPEQVRGRRIPDIRLTDQNGHSVRFLSDVLRQRKALISFIYTSCQT